MVDVALSTLQRRLSATEGINLVVKAKRLQDATTEFLAAIHSALSDERERHAEVARRQERLQRVLADLHGAAERGDGTDSLALVFTASEGRPGVRITRSRALVSQWSPAFAALARHGNGLEGGFPCEVRLDDVDPAVFRTASDVMTSGRLAEELVRPLEEEQHPLLEFADRFDLRDIVDDYFAVIVRRNPLTRASAMRVLELALRANATAVADQAVSFLARDSSFFEPELSSSAPFCSLSREAASAVLSHDELAASPEPCLKEARVVQLVLSWVQHNRERADQAAAQLFESIRFELLGFGDLADLQAKLGTLAGLDEGARAKVGAAIARTMRQKLSQEAGAVSGPPRKRKLTSLPDASNEESVRKILRTALELCGPCWNAAAPASAGCAEPP